MSAELIDRCTVCGDYDLVPIQVGICTACAKKAHRMRAEIEAEGGRLVVVGGEFMKFSASELESPEGHLSYSYAVQCSLAEMREHKTRHAGEA